MDTEFVTAVEMVGNDQNKAKAFRGALREQKFPWHQHNDRWTVRRDSREHDDMRRVLATHAVNSPQCLEVRKARSAPPT